MLRTGGRSSTKAPWFDLEDGNAGKETGELNQARTFVSADCSEKTYGALRGGVIYLCLANIPTSAHCGPGTTKYGPWTSGSGIGYRILFFLLRNDQCIQTVYCLQAKRRDSWLLWTRPTLGNPRSSRPVSWDMEWKRVSVFLLGQPKQLSYRVSEANCSWSANFSKPQSLGINAHVQLVQYTIKLIVPFLRLRARLQHRAGLRKEPTSRAAEGYANFESLLGDSRTLWRMWG